MTTTRLDRHTATPSSLVSGQRAAARVLASQRPVGRGAGHSAPQAARLSPLLRLAPLVLVAPPLIAFLLARPSDERIFSLLPAVATFVAIVVWALTASRPALPRRALISGSLLSLLALTVILADPRALWLTLFYYPAVAAGLIGATRHALAGVGMVSFVAALAGWQGVGDGVAAFEFALECVLLGAAALAVAQLLVTNRELAAARVGIVRLAAADERVRIARDLHDLLGHGLSVISLKAELAGRLLPREAQRAADEVRDIESVSRRALEDVRATVRGYRRVTLEAELIEARTALEAAGVGVEIHHAAGNLESELDEALAWSVREGVTNVIRHGNSRHSTIRIGRDDSHVRLDIANDGAGSRERRFENASRRAAGGSGLRGLAERVSAVGGRLESGPYLEESYRLVVELPVRAPD